VVRDEKIGPTMPPDPWNPPKATAGDDDGETGIGPTMPPDPWNPPKLA
jgi:hypothetical protein